MRLIDADELNAFKMEDISGMVDLPYREFNKAFTLGWNNAIIEITKRAPTVDTKKHGHWTQGDRDFIYICSNCEEMTANAIFYGFKGEKYMMNYCPNCGAKMDEVNV